MSSSASLIMNAQTKEKAIAFLDLVESSLSQLTEEAPKTASEDMAALVKACRSLSSFAWALKTFPVFDPSCLTQKHVAEVAAQLNGNRAKFKLLVPVFGRAPYSPNGNTVHEFLQPYSQPEEIQKALIEAAGRTSLNVQITATCPAPPKSVREKVAAVQDRFDKIDLAWEAQWTAEVRVEDPLVLGVIGRTEFLIDEYDASKLERYIASEFTRSKPKE